MVLIGFLFPSEYLH